MAVQARSDLQSAVQVGGEWELICMYACSNTKYVYAFQGRREWECQSARGSRKQSSFFNGSATKALPLLYNELDVVPYDELVCGREVYRPALLEASI